MLGLELELGLGLGLVWRLLPKRGPEVALEHEDAGLSGALRHLPWYHSTTRVQSVCVVRRAVRGAIRGAVRRAVRAGCSELPRGCLCHL